MEEHETNPAARRRCLRKHTIFLSHSGKEKAFVEQLCEDLKRMNHSPFFDQDSDSLPISESFSSLIFSSAEQCLLGVVVLSEGYLSSKWPMLELSTFVKSRKATNPDLKLMPVFYKLSPGDLCAEKVETVWSESWEKLVQEGKVSAEEIASWSDAVRELRAFNGLEFSRYGTSEVKYRAAVVDEICNNVPPVLKYNTDNIRGCERLCEITSRMFEEGTCEDITCTEGCYYLGLYGLGGVGKSTLCRAMCSYFQAKYGMRVCHVELPSDAKEEQIAEKNRLSRLKFLIQELTSLDSRIVDRIASESQGLECLQNGLSRQPAVFIAVDNVGRSLSSRDEARGLVETVHASGSKVMVTSRSKAILKSIFYSEKYCKPISRLEAHEARELFLSVAAPRKLLCPLQSCEEEIVEECLADCQFPEVGYTTRQYHPLALRALGSYFYDVDEEDIMKWKEHLWVENKLQGSRESKRVRKGIQLGALLGIDCGINLGSGEPVDVELQNPHHVETPRNDEHGGRNKQEAELHVVDMVYADIPLDSESTRIEVIMECLIASVQGVEAQVAKFSRLDSGNHIRVFNHIQLSNQECDSLVDTLADTVHDRLRRYNITLSLVQRRAGVSDPESRIFMSVAFCIVALVELERMFKAVVDLLTMCSKEDWWNTALELSNALPSPTIPRWSSFSLAIRSCAWSMDIVDFGFHALEQFLAGASTVTGVVFKWSDKQSRMVLYIDGKPLYHDEGGSSLLDVTRDLEGKDVTALKKKLVDLNETRERTLLKRFLKADANMHSIADVLSQKLDGPRPEPNSVPYTFRINPSTLKNFVAYIGKGSYGWVAEYKWLGQKVSVKKMKSPGLSRKQFEMEAAILATVQHPRVVRMIGCTFEENKETGSLVMELMEGDLRHAIEKRSLNLARGVSPFPLRVAMDIMLQIGEGMQYLREHMIMHRDLKAMNVLLNRCRTSKCGAYGKFPALASLLHTEQYYIVKLADFGIAKARRGQTKFKTKVGTTFWMAPEVYRVPDAENYEWPADVYSFAMTCYEILTGCIPFDNVPNPELYNRIVAGERPPLDDVKMPPLLRDLVERCWKTDPNDRPDFDEICRTLWQCKVENILPAFKLQIGHSETESVAVKAYGESSRVSP